MLLVKKIYKLLEFARQIYHREIFVKNINLDLASGVKQKKVLICYLDIYTAGTYVNSGLVHTNFQEFFQILQCMIKCNMVVDICNNSFDFRNEILPNDYDVILGFGDAFFTASKANPNAYKVLYMTENPYYISAKRAKERLDYLYERKKIKAKDVRSGVFYKKDDEKKCNAIICVGEESYFDNTKQVVKRIFPSALKNKSFQKNDIVLSNMKKKTFLVLASNGFVHKGMDLVIELFSKHEDWILYYCGKGLKDSCKKIKENIPSNVIDCGFICVDSEEFYIIAKECNFILHPSCSEGMSTSVLTGMMHGMIPIVTRGNGFDSFSQYCIMLDDFHLNAMEETIIQLLGQAPDELYYKRLDIYNFSNQTFTLSEYTKQFFSVWQDLMKDVMIHV